MIFTAIFDSGDKATIFCHSKFMLLNQKTVFLLDGIGALASAICTAMILPQFSELLGISKSLLYSLAAIPAVYMVYSFVCYFLIRQLRAGMLVAIIAANFIYCLITAGLIVLYKPLTAIGAGFFAFEIVIIFCVIFLEVKILKREFLS